MGGRQQRTMRGLVEERVGVGQGSDKRERLPDTHGA